MLGESILRKKVKRGANATPLAAFLAIVLLHAQTSVAQTATVLADGIAWTMTSESGPSGEIVMFSDGSGRMKARGLSFGMSWTLQGSQLCITARIRGTQCADLVETAQGFRAERDGETVFALSR